MSQQIELFVIDNPCIGVCRSNKKGYCFGCLRSRTERQLWLKMSDEQRRDVLRLIVGRRRRIENMRSQHKQQMDLDFEPTEALLDLFDTFNH